jgi:beta-lactamase superfamily II metal-dependent hydrolase
MSIRFYLFDVDHGQCAALLLPNGRWCVFDVGCTNTFSPVLWIAGTNGLSALSGLIGLQYKFQFLKGTISHLHGDHLGDYDKLFQYGPEFMRTVAADQGYLGDCYATCATTEGKTKIRDYMNSYANGFSTATSIPDYAGVQIREISLPVAVARQIGGDANARVNNASIVTRIDAHGNSILLCGDMQKEAWEAILNDTGNFGLSWRPLVSNIDILVAPHHGHASAYSTSLLQLAKPSVVLASVVTRDPNVDTRYSQSPVRGITLGNTGYMSITTRKYGHIRIEIQPSQNFMLSGGKGGKFWTFGDAALR